MPSSQLTIRHISLPARLPRPARCGWRVAASGRKWPQVAAFGDFNFHTQSNLPDVCSPHLCVGFLFLVVHFRPARPPPASRPPPTTCPHTTYSHTGVALGDIDRHFAWQRLNLGSSFTTSQSLVCVKTSLRRCFCVQINMQNHPCLNDSVSASFFV